MKRALTIVAVGSIAALFGTGCRIVPISGADTYETCFSTSDCAQVSDLCVSIAGPADTRTACTHSCSTDFDCEYSGRCLSFDGGGSFFCVDDCVSNTCEPGWSCSTVDAGDNVCLPGGGGGGVATYDNCVSSADCSIAADVCVQIPGAVTTEQACTHECSFDSDCSSSGRCLSFDGGSSFFCVESCVSETCATGWSCQSVDARGNACLPGSPGIPAYDECTVGTDTCSGGLGCSSITVDSVTAGLCTTHTCGAGAPCPRDSMGETGRCISFDGGGLFTCFEPCSVATDCAPGWTCKSRLADGTSFDPICLPM